MGSVALLENTEVDEYYRNDSLKSVGKGNEVSTMICVVRGGVIVWGWA